MAPGATATLEMRSAAEARDLVGSLQPKPWPTDRRAALAALTGAVRFAEDQPGHVVWLSDGLEEGGTAALVRDLKTLGAMTVIEPGRLPFHTNNPALALLTDGRVMVYGAMGGEGQPQTQSAVYSRYAMFGQDLQASITAPRWVPGRTGGEPKWGRRPGGRG